MIGHWIRLALGNWQIVAGAIALLVLSNGLSYCKGRSDGHDLRDAEYAAAARIAAEKARKADGVARDTVDAEKGTVAAENEAARDAAIGSDDPLRDGLRALD